MVRVKEYTSRVAYFTVGELRDIAKETGTPADIKEDLEHIIECLVDYDPGLDEEDELQLNDFDNSVWGDYGRYDDEYVFSRDSEYLLDWLKENKGG